MRTRWLSLLIIALLLALILALAHQGSPLIAQEPRPHSYRDPLGNTEFR